MSAKSGQIVMFIGCMVFDDCKFCGPFKMITQHRLIAPYAADQVLEVVVGSFETFRVKR